MSKHTPGPWTADSHYPSVSAPNAPNLALCNDHAIPISERIANARLIAVAPMMYEYIVSSASNGCAEAKKLIAKAEGKL